MSDQIKVRLLLGFAVLVLSATLFVPPIAQDLAYHEFADTDLILGVPNMWNVISNLPFILFGVYGLLAVQRLCDDRLPNDYQTIARLMFAGLVLTGFGSGYYHLAPSNETLVWDRLPMTIAFMAFFSFVVAIHINQRTGRVLLWPLIVVGMSSVLYWAYSESIGAGDLRFYAVIQFLPMVLIPIIVLVFPARGYRPFYIWCVILIYISAKLAEYFDLQIYDLMGLSGHSLKHLLASLSAIAFLSAIKSINVKTEIRQAVSSGDN